MTTRQVCPTCFGEGATDADEEFLDGEVCLTCDGSGSIEVWDPPDPEAAQEAALRALRRWQLAGIPEGEDARDHFELVRLLKLTLALGWPPTEADYAARLRAIDDATACLERVLDGYGAPRLEELP